MTVSILFGTRFLPMIPRSVVAATKLVRVGRGRGARLERDHTPSSPSSRGRRREHPRLRRRAGPSRQHLRGAAPAPPSPPTAHRLRRSRAHLRGPARGRSAPPQLAGGHAGVRVAEPWRRRSSQGQGVSRPGPGPGQQQERRRTGTKARFAVPGRMITSRGIFLVSRGFGALSPSHLRPCGCGSRTAHSARRSHRGPSRWQARGAQAPRARPLRRSKRRRGDRVLSALDSSTSAILLAIAREAVFCCHWSSGARRSALPPP